MRHFRLIILLFLSLCLSAAPGLAASATAPAAAAGAAKTEKAAPAKAEKTDKAAGAVDKDKAADAASDQKTDGGTAGTEAAPPKHDPWEMIWAGQRGMLNEIKETAVRLSDGFSDQAANLTGKVQPYEEEARRLLVLTNTFKNWPNPMEAVSRRITVTVTQLNQVLEPVMLARSEAQGLLERVNYMADSLPEDLTPDYELLRTQFSRVTKLLREKKGISAAAVTTLAATVAKSCFGNGLGFAFEGEYDLFNYRPGSILVELEKGAEIPEGAVLLGYVTLEPVLSAGAVAVPVNVLQSGWENTLRKVFPAAVSQQGDNGNRPLFTERSACRPAQSIARPRVVIPAFPGTNCELDSARAMERAGAKADVVLVRNMTPAAI